MALSPAVTQYPFLASMKPFYSATDFKKDFNKHYPIWEAVVFVGRWWCLSLRADKIRPPAALLIFGMSKDTTNKENFNATSENDKNTRHLLFATVLEDAKPLTASAELIATISNCPSFYRPMTIRVSYYSQVQHSLDLIRGVVGSRICTQVIEITQKEKLTTTTCLAQPTQTIDGDQNGEPVNDISPLNQPIAIQFEVAIKQNEERERTASTASTLKMFESDPFMEHVVQWMQLERKMFPDASMQPFTTVGPKADDGESATGEKENIESILKLGATYPQLSTMRVARQQDANSQVDLTNHEKRHLQNQLVCATFTVPDNVLPNNKYPHVLLLQRPRAATSAPVSSNGATAAAAASEGIEVGPVQPQPIGVEFHLHSDPGDALYVFGILSKPLNVQLYEDLLHPDGEVYVQFGPVEGAAVVDAEAAIKTFGETQISTAQWGFTAFERKLDASMGTTTATASSTHLRVVGENSNFFVPVPRVVFNAPTGKTERRTPLESPKTTLASSSPNADMLAAAAAAVRYFVDELIVKDDSQNNNSNAATAGKSFNNITYEINWDKAQLTPSQGSSLVTMPSCHFCHRKRQKMMRCGGCKVTNYCCADHQAKDWKGSHKNECKLLKVADDDYKTLIVPALEQINRNSGALQPNAENPIDPLARQEEAESDSNVLTFFKLLDLCKVGINTVDEKFLGKIKANRAEIIAAESKKSNHPAYSSSKDLDNVIVVHLLHVEDAYAFMQSLSRWANRNQALLSQLRKQYRIVIANTKTTKPSDQGKVFSLRKTDKKGTDNQNVFVFGEIEATGVLGDIWRAATSSSQQMAEGVSAPVSPFLIRLYHDRYHHLADKAFASPVLAPDVVLSIGTKSLQGQGFFNAATETIADDVLGKIPFGFSEPHYLAAHRTLQGLHNRTSMSPVNKNPQYDDSTQLNKLVVNEEGLCPSAVLSDDATSDGNVPLSAVPLHLNAYISVLLPKLK